jgi:hypothetical protein
MAVPGKYDLDIYRGDTFRQVVVLWGDDAKTQPVDLAGATVAAEIRDKAMGKVLATFGCTVTPPNTIEIGLAAAVSGTLTGKGVWDLQVTFPGGDVRTFLAGAVKITTDVTDSAPAVQGLRAVL